jgi:hypothetical protein
MNVRVVVGAFCALAMTSGHASAQASSPRLPLVEDLRLGTLADPNLQFVILRSVRQFANGDIAVATSLAPSAWNVQVFDSTGRPRWKREFAGNDFPVALAIAGDTLVVQVGVYSEARLLFFRVGRDAPLRATDAHAGDCSSSPALLGSLAGTPVAVTVIAYEPGACLQPVPRPVREFRAIEHSDVSAKPFFTMTDSTPRAIYEVSAAIHRSISGTLPWAPVPSFAAAGGQLFVARGATYDIDVVAANGQRVRRVSVAQPLHSITIDEQNVWFAEWRNSYLSKLHSDSGLTMVRALPSSPTRPVIGAIFASAAGELAVVRADKYPSPVRHGNTTFVDILNADGTVRGNIAVPSNVYIESFSGQYLYGIVRDSTRIAGYEGGRSPMSLNQLVRFRIGAPSRR